MVIGDNELVYRSSYNGQALKISKLLQCTEADKLEIS